MKNKKTLIRNLILLISLIVVVFIIIFSIGDIKNITNALLNADYKYILIVILLTLVYVILWPLSLALIIKKKEGFMKLSDCYKISATELFFNGITPFSSGGQPYQAYALKQKGVKLSEGTSILMINFIIYQVVINVFSIFALAFYFNRIKEEISAIIYITLIGFIINFLILLLLLAIALSKKTGVIIHKFLTFLTKFRLFKKLEKFIPNVDLYVEEVQKAFKEMGKNYKNIVLTTIIKIIALLIFYAIPFYGLKALHIDIGYENIFYVVSMTCFALTMVVWLPTPGSSGGAEFAFSTIFQSLSISTDLSLSLMLIWRFSTYYLVMLYGFIMYLLLQRRDKNENRDLYRCVQTTD